MRRENINYGWLTIGGHCVDAGRSSAVRQFLDVVVVKGEVAWKVFVNVKCGEASVKRFKVHLPDALPPVDDYFAPPRPVRGGYVAQSTFQSFMAVLMGHGPFMSHDNVHNPQIKLFAVGFLVDET